MPGVLGLVPFDALGLALAAPGLGLVPGLAFEALGPTPAVVTAPTLGLSLDVVGNLGPAALAPWLVVVVAPDLTLAAVGFNFAALGPDFRAMLPVVAYILGGGGVLVGNCWGVQRHPLNRPHLRLVC